MQKRSYPTDAIFLRDPVEPRGVPVRLRFQVLSCQSGRGRRTEDQHFHVGIRDFRRCRTRPRRRWSLVPAVRLHHGETSGDEQDPVWPGWSPREDRLRFHDQFGRDCHDH